MELIKSNNRNQNLLLEIKKELSEINNQEELSDWFNCLKSNKSRNEVFDDNSVINWPSKLYSMHSIKCEQIEFKKKYPDLYELYDTVILNKNPKGLVMKTKSKIQELSKLFVLNNLDVFIDFVNTMSIVRSDENQYDEYISPILSGIHNDYIEYHDGFMAAENYIYSSFDGIAHINTHHGLIENYGRIKNWSQELKKTNNIRDLDESDIENNAEIIFNDLLFIGSYIGFEEDYIEVYKTYLENCFDYKNGKKLLAIYLSIVFDTPNEAIKYFSGNKGMIDMKIWTNFHNKNYSEINKKIKELYDKTGLMPPCQLEVRIHDKVRLKNIYQDTIKGTVEKTNKIL